MLAGHHPSRLISKWQIEKFLSDKMHPKQVTVPYLKLIQGKYSDAESDYKTYKLLWKSNKNCDCCSKKGELNESN